MDELLRRLHNAQAVLERYGYVDEARAVNEARELIANPAGLPAPASAADTGTPGVDPPEHQHV